jgi:hypothetical protein
MTNPCSRQLVVLGSIYETVSCLNVLLGHEFLELDYIDGVDSTKIRLRYPVDIFLDYWRQKVSKEAPMGSDLSPEMISMARTLSAGQVRHTFGYHEASEDNVAEYM